MKRNLRKAIYNKKMSYHKYTKNKNSRIWEKYRQSRNLVNKIKKKNNLLKSTFKIDVLVAVNLQIFGAQLNHICLKKAGNSLNKIILNENNKIISNNEEVAKNFNNYFVNVADGIGKDYVFNPQDHPSLKMINEKQFQKVKCEFKHTNQETVTKIIDKFNPKKATGADKISVKLLKLTKNTLDEPITDLINTSIKTCTFPNCAKRAQVAPLFKKVNAMTKSNYRPVSLLPIPSKFLKKYFLTSSLNILTIFLMISCVRSERVMDVKQHLLDFWRIGNVL